MRDFHPYWAPRLKLFLSDLLENGPSTGPEISRRTGLSLIEHKRPYGSEISGLMAVCQDDLLASFVHPIPAGPSIMTITDLGREYLRHNAGLGHDAVDDYLGGW
jgi:hypothetical protein